MFFCVKLWNLLCQTIKVLFFVIIKLWNLLCLLTVKCHFWSRKNCQTTVLPVCLKKNKLYMSVYIFKPKDGILYAYFFNQKYSEVLYAVASALTGTGAVNFRDSEFLFWGQCTERLRGRLNRKLILKVILSFTRQSSNSFSLTNCRRRRRAYSFRFRSAAAPQHSGVGPVSDRNELGRLSWLISGLWNQQM